MKGTAPRFYAARPRPTSWLIAGIAFVMVPSFRAEAARIDTTALSRTEAHDDALWANYLAEGTHEWLTHAHPPVTPSLEASVWRSLARGTASDNAMVQFLLWRQSLDPSRFDFYHPRLAVAFAKLKSPTVSPGTVSTPTTLPATVVPPEVPNITPEAQVLPQVPEPSGLWIALGMLAGGAWLGGKARRR
jgi:hypothetical protein